MGCAKASLMICLCKEGISTTLFIYPLNCSLPSAPAPLASPGAARSHRSTGPTTRPLRPPAPPATFCHMDHLQALPQDTLVRDVCRSCPSSHGAYTGGHIGLWPLGSRPPANAPEPLSGPWDRWTPRPTVCQSAQSGR